MDFVTMLNKSLIWLYRGLLALAITLTAALHAKAESRPTRPTIIVAPQISISDEQITLGKIAQISNKYGEFDKLVERLSNISFGEAPPPTMQLTLTGQKILASIEKEGIALDSIGYSIPQVVTIERKGRALAKEEVLSAVREMLAQDAALDVQVRDVTWSNPQVVPDGNIRFSVERLGLPEAGKLPLRITAFVNSAPAARFLATAVADDWREVPVLNKALERGMLISSDDIEVIRMNLFKQSPNIADKLQQVIGRRAKQRLNAGETISKNLIDIPPVIPTGKPVMAVYRSGGLSASVTGVAMEDGFENGVIRIKNESSHRVFKGRVVSAEQVEVIP